MKRCFYFQSTHGTYVNNERITEATEVVAGDVIGVGKSATEIQESSSTYFALPLLGCNPTVSILKVLGMEIVEIADHVVDELAELLAQNEVIELVAQNHADEVIEISDDEETATDQSWKTKLNGDIHSKKENKAKIGQTGYFYDLSCLPPMRDLKVDVTNLSSKTVDQYLKSSFRVAPSESKEDSNTVARIRKVRVEGATEKIATSKIVDDDTDSESDEKPVKRRKIEKEKRKSSSESDGGSSYSSNSQKAYQKSSVNKGRKSIPQHRPSSSKAGKCPSEKHHQGVAPRRKSAGLGSNYEDLREEMKFVPVGKIHKIRVEGATEKIVTCKVVDDDTDSGSDDMFTEKPRAEKKKETSSSESDVRNSFASSSSSTNFKKAVKKSAENSEKKSFSQHRTSTSKAGNHPSSGKHQDLTKKIPPRRQTICMEAKPQLPLRRKSAGFATDHVDVFSMYTQMHTNRMYGTPARRLSVDDATRDVQEQKKQRKARLQSIADRKIPEHGAQKEVQKSSTATSKVKITKNNRGAFLSEIPPSIRIPKKAQGDISTSSTADTSVVNEPGESTKKRTVQEAAVKKALEIIKAKYDPQPVYLKFNNLNFYQRVEKTIDTETRNTNPLPGPVGFYNPICQSKDSTAESFDDNMNATRRSILKAPSDPVKPKKSTSFADQVEIREFEVEMFARTEDVQIVPTSKDHDPSSFVYPSNEHFHTSISNWNQPKYSTSTVMQYVSPSISETFAPKTAQAPIAKLSSRDPRIAHRLTEHVPEVIKQWSPDQEPVTVTFRKLSENGKLSENVNIHKILNWNPDRLESPDHPELLQKIKTDIKHSESIDWEPLMKKLSIPEGGMTLLKLTATPMSNSYKLGALLLLKIKNFITQNEEKFFGYISSSEIQEGEEQITVYTKGSLGSLEEVTVINSRFVSDILPKLLSDL